MGEPGRLKSVRIVVSIQISVTITAKFFGADEPADSGATEATGFYSKGPFGGRPPHVRPLHGHCILYTSRSLHVFASSSRTAVLTCSSSQRTAASAQRCCMRLPRCLELQHTLQYSWLLSRQRPDNVPLEYLCESALCKGT